MYVLDPDVMLFEFVFRLLILIYPLNLGPSACHEFDCLIFEIEQVNEFSASVNFAYVHTFPNTLYLTTQHFKVIVNKMQNISLNIIIQFSV